MIEIDHIGKLPFPAVEFSFVNRGKATAQLTQIDLEVFEGEIDPTPVLRFWVAAFRGILKIFARNEGWGPAVDADILFSEPLLDRLFHEHDRRFQGQIKGEDNTLLLELNMGNANAGGIETVRALLDERNQFLPMLAKAMRKGSKRILSRESFERVLAADEQDDVRRYFKRSSSGWIRRYAREKHVLFGQTRTDPDMARIAALTGEYVPVKNIFAEGTYMDVCHAPHSIRYEIPSAKTDDLEAVSEQLWMNADSFCREVHLTSTFPPPFSDLTVAMARLSYIPFRKEYPVSLVVLPSDREKFSLTVGADKSAKLKARFSFCFNRGGFLYSDPFDLRVWRPVNTSIWTCGMRFNDGEQFINDEGTWKLADGNGHIGLHKWRL